MSGCESIRFFSDGERLDRELWCPYACLCFDYRGFGFSDGERGRLVPEEQVEDIRAAVDYVQHREETAASPVILLGWGSGARW